MCVAAGQPRTADLVVCNSKTAAEEAKNPIFADDRDLKVFASLLPKARFAPVIPGWEDIAQTASNALQKIYLGQGQIEPTLKDAAAKVNETLAKKLSPDLKKKMQGKSCFNFTGADPKLFRELAKVTAAGFTLYKRKNLL